MSSISGTVGSFQLEEAFTGWRALTIVSSLMSGRAEVMTLRDLMEEYLAEVSSAS